jgi:cobalt-zinc-cadmium efflux system outer membrane protein
MFNFFDDAYQRVFTPHGLGLYLCSLLLVLPITAAQATSLAAPQTSISLPQVISQTLAHNPALKVFEFKQRALNGQLQTAQLTPAYSVDINADNLVGSGVHADAAQAEWSVSLSSVLELGQKQDARVALANSDLSHSRAQRQIQALATLTDVTRSYIQVLAAQERVALANTSHELAQKVLTLVKKRAQAGAAPPAEVLRAKAAAIQSKLNVTLQQQQLNYLKVALAAHWGSDQANFTNVAGDLYDFGGDTSFSELITRLEQSPAMQVFASQEQMYNAQLKVAQAQSSGDLSWSLGVKQFEQSNSEALMAAISIPLFSGARNRGAMQTAHANLKATGADKKAARLQLHTRLLQAFSNRQQAKHTANTLRQTVVPTLTQALTETRKAYQQGRYGYGEYLGAQKDLINAHAALIDAAANALNYAALIEQLSAQPITISQLRPLTLIGNK